MDSPIAIANFFIQKSFDTGKEITPMKVVKLVYISHGWSLGIVDEPLINERISAWKFGPVVESVYHEFKRYGSNQITSLGTEFSGLKVITPCVDETKYELLNRIWEVYGDMDGIELSSLTHQKGTPWDIVYNQPGGSKGNSPIPNDLIKQHYKDKIAANG